MRVTRDNSDKLSVPFVGYYTKKRPGSHDATTECTPSIYTNVSHYLQVHRTIVSYWKWLGMSFNCPSIYSSSFSSLYLYKAGYGFHVTASGKTKDLSSAKFKIWSTEFSEITRATVMTSMTLMSAYTLCSLLNWSLPIKFFPLPFDEDTIFVVDFACSRLIHTWSRVMSLQNAYKLYTILNSTTVADNQTWNFWYLTTRHFPRQSDFRFGFSSS